WGRGTAPGNPTGASLSAPPEARGQEPRSDQLLAFDEAGEPVPKVLADVLPADRELGGFLHVIEVFADGEAPALEHVGIDGLLLREQVDRVRELQLATDSRLGPPQAVEDLGRQDVPADGAHVRRRLLGR